MCALTFMYQPFAWSPPPPPVPYPEQGPVPDTMRYQQQQKSQPTTPPPQQQPKNQSSGLWGSISSAIGRAAKEIDQGVRQFDAKLHIGMVDTLFRSKFGIPSTEPLLCDFFAKSFDSSNVIFSAGILLYGLHLCFLLSTPDSREAAIVIPLNHIITWERAITQRPPPPSITTTTLPPPQIPSIISIASGGIPDAVKLYTVDGRLHLFFGFTGNGDASRFYRAFDPTWRSSFPQPIPTVPFYNSH